MADIDQLLAERGQVHGDFSVHAGITQALKDELHRARNWFLLTPVHKEALEMIVHKIGRILAGNPDHADHWDDIAGYARLVSRQVPEPLAGTPATNVVRPVTAENPALGASYGTQAPVVGEDGADHRPSTAPAPVVS